MKFPSKELLSEVLGLEIKEIKNKSNGALYVTDNCVGFSTKEETAGLINIYELAHKCKEWATSKGYIMLSYMEDDKTGYVSLGDLFGQTKVKLPQPKDSFWFEADTELEAIFKACEWIMEQTK